MAHLSTWVPSFINIESAKQVFPNLTFTRFNLCSLFIIPFLVSSAFSIPSLGGSELRATDTLSSWLAFESSYALQGIIDNIGDGGSKVSGAESGILIASPSKSNPDCEHSLL